MGAYKTNENDAGIVVDFDDESERITLDVEDNPIASQNIRAGILLLDFPKRSPPSVSGFVKPNQQWFFGLRMFLPEGFEGLPCDDTHVGCEFIAASSR